MQQKQFRQITYQTRLEIDNKTEEILSLYAELFSYLEKRLFKELIKEKNLNELKKEYIKKYQITARQFNSLRFQIDGKIKSANEIRKNQILTLKQKIKHLKKVIPKYKNPNKIHQKKRKLYSLELKLQKLENQKKPKICFGTKKLFNKQFHLEENGFKNFEEWKTQWQKARKNSFFIIGSKDETCGNQSAQLFEENSTLSLKIRLPNKFLNYGKYLIIKNINFAYGKKKILEAIEDNLLRKRLSQEKNSSFKYFGRAINYRFLKDKKGFRVFVTITLEESNWISKEENGLIGIDINSDHLALVETDRFLNPIKSKRISLCTYGKNKNQTQAIIGDAISKIVEIAKKTKKPIVIEILDFQTKKTQLKEKNKRYARILSSFSYNKIIETIKSRAFRNKIKVFEVNPAFTSVIGRVKFQKRYGLSSHQAAALTIARRLKQASEKIPHQTFIFDAKGSMSAFFLPERNREKHLWSSWGQVFGLLKAVDALHYRAMNSRSTNTHKSVCEIETLDNYERNSHTLTSVEKTASSTSLKKSLLHV